MTNILRVNGAEIPKDLGSKITVNINSDISQIIQALKYALLIAFLVFNIGICFEINDINEEIKAMKNNRELIIDHRLNKIEEAVGLVE